MAHDVGKETVSVQKLSHPVSLANSNNYIRTYSKLKSKLMIRVVFREILLPMHNSYSMYLFIEYSSLVSKDTSLHKL